MSSIFTLDNVSDFSEKINLDDLYEKKRTCDLGKQELYNKILNRIHVRIKTTARQRVDEQFCWFVVPEVILGVPRYDQGECIGYLIDKLNENGFKLKYIHPNTLLIVWAHFVPSYVRTELKNKTGIVVDEHGKIIEKMKDKERSIVQQKVDSLFEVQFNQPEQSHTNNTTVKNSNHKKYTPIHSYKPQGNIFYEEDDLASLFSKPEKNS